ncbi:hypothetical protein RKD22_003874 [Streptomyces pristinaespiralis]
MKPRAPLVDFAGTHAELGFTEVVIHWPIPDSGKADVWQRVVGSRHVQEASRGSVAGRLGTDGGWELNPTDSNR